LAATGDDQLWCELVKVLENWIQPRIDNFLLCYSSRRQMRPPPDITGAPLAEGSALTDDGLDFAASALLRR